MVCAGRLPAGLSMASGHAEDSAVEEPSKAVVVEGPGRGECFSLIPGALQIGRGEGQGIRLDFGDNTISRENHAAIAYDAEENEFVIGQGGKANIVRLNGRPVLSNETVKHGDNIRIGKTTLRCVALCGDDFSWGNDNGGRG